MALKDDLIKFLQGYDEGVELDPVTETPIDNGFDDDVENLGTKEIDVSVDEETEVNAPEIDETDLTVMSSSDLLNQSIDERLSGFYKKQLELETAIKIMLDEINIIKNTVNMIETNFDDIKDLEVTDLTLDSLLNQI